MCVVVGLLTSGTEANTGARTAAATTAASPAVAARTSPAARKSSATAGAEDACHKRAPASGDIYVRTLRPGAHWTARELGGGWAWNGTLRECLTAVQAVIATAPLGAGDCTQVGYAADNPGYDPNAAVAAALARVVKHAGPACAAVTPASATPMTPSAPAPTVPAPTMPAATPAPAPSATHASCHPLTNGGNCYEPGEFCRKADHGESGVAGNGEAIICEDNDGWRWEPA